MLQNRFQADYSCRSVEYRRQSVLLRVMNPLAGAGIFAAINLILLLTLLRQCSRMSLISQDEQ